MDIKKFEHELHELWNMHMKDEPDFTFTIVLVNVDKKGDIQAGFVISSNCPVCHSKFLAEIIESNNISHTYSSEEEKSNKVH